MGLKKSVVVFGKYYDSVRNACKALNISYHTVQSAVKAKKYSHADALEILLSKIQDHHGRRFRTYKQMCEFYGVKYYTFSKRLHDGWSIEKCLSCKSYAGKRNHDSKP